MMLLESGPVLNTIHLIHEHIRLTAKIDGEPYFIPDFNSYFNSYLFLSHCCCGMCYIQILDSLDPAETCDLGIHAVELTGSIELA